MNNLHSAITNMSSKFKNKPYKNSETPGWNCLRGFKASRGYISNLRPTLSGANYAARNGDWDDSACGHWLLFRNWKCGDFQCCHLSSTGLPLPCRIGSSWLSPGVWHVRDTWQPPTSRTKPKTTTRRRRQWKTKWKFKPQQEATKKASKGAEPEEPKSCRQQVCKSNSFIDF